MSTPEHNKRRNRKRKERRQRRALAQQVAKPSAPDWTRKCENCGAFPVADVTGLCGPCTFGDASTAGGNW